METLEVIKNRRSYRNFYPNEIPEDILDKIIEAGTYSASGRGLQSPIIVAITNKAVIKMLSNLNRKFLEGKKEDFDPFFGAPAVLVVLADKNVSTYLYDGSIVMANLMLAAEDQGVGSCWIHRAKQMFETKEGKDILAAVGICGDYEGIGNLVLGFKRGEVPEEKEIKKDYVYYI